MHRLREVEAETASRPKPLPEWLTSEEARQWNEIVGGGACRLVRERVTSALGSFLPARRLCAPGDFEPERWQATFDGMLRICDEWAGCAAAVGWQPSEVFAMDLTTPAARHDQRGLALSLGGVPASWGRRGRR